MTNFVYGFLAGMTFGIGLTVLAVAIYHHRSRMEDWDRLIREAKREEAYLRGERR